MPLVILGSLRVCACFYLWLFLLVTAGDFVDTVLSLSPEKRPTISTRPYFGEEFSYVMDAKSMGNLGRYLNVGIFQPNHQSYNLGDSHHYPFYPREAVTPQD